VLTNAVLLAEKPTKMSSDPSAPPATLLPASKLGGVAGATQLAPLSKPPASAALLTTPSAGISKFKAQKNYSLWSRLIGADKENVALRVEARKGGTSKIKTHYLSDFNMLESTFLIAAIVILLCGVMFKAAEFTSGYDRACLFAWRARCVCVAC
jgi:hypothetical protein